MVIELDTGVLVSVSASVVVTIVSAWWALAKMMVRQFERRQDERFVLLTDALREQKIEQDGVMAEIRRVENEVSRAQIEAAGRFMTRAEATSQHQQILDAIRGLGSRIDSLHGRSLGVAQ